MIRTLFIVFLSGFLFSYTEWRTDFEQVLKEAKEKHEFILINFSGSDWCGPCIRMKKEIFDSPVFIEMSKTNLLLVNADFPRNKKNQLSKTLQAQNDVLAEKFNSAGKFPLTVLIDENEHVLKTWEGLPQEGAEGFTIAVKQICDAHR
jgi:thioredoxin-related protein